jgi:crossover junction endodeoxyribonuclease RusA
MRLTLPFPISANRYWRVGKNRVYRSEEATAYKDEVGWLCKAEGINPFKGNVCVSLDFYRPAKRGDTDNMIKVTLDSLIGYAYVDDKQIVELHAMRHDDKDDPRVEVLVTEVLP